MSWVSNAQISELSSGTCPATVAATADSSAATVASPPSIRKSSRCLGPLSTPSTHAPWTCNRVPIRWSFCVRRTTAAHFSVLSTRCPHRHPSLQLETTTRIQEEPMNPLSEQLSDLADRAKQAEDMSPLHR